MARTKTDRLNALHNARREAAVGAVLAHDPDLRAACVSAARVLEREAARIALLPDSPDLISSLERVTGLVVASLGIAVRQHEEEAKRIGVADTPMALAVVCSAT